MREVDWGELGVLPALGQGTWRMGEDRTRATEEARALETGLDLGMTVIDTAEMYGDGATETFLGEAIGHRRDDAVLVSKAYPRNASRRRLPDACEGSLRRLRTDHLDLYLLHWPGDVPLAETVEAMAMLKKAGKIRAWGVSNFDVTDLDELRDAGGGACLVNQILYNVARRGPEHGLLPLMMERSIAAMAYSPIEQGRLQANDALSRIAERHGVTAYQIALAWVLRDGAMGIPKAANDRHVRANRKAADIELSDDDRALLDAAFPAPTAKRPLEML